MVESIMGDGAKRVGALPWLDTGLLGRSLSLKGSKCSVDFCSTSSFHVHVGGAEAGPGETGRGPGVELPRSRFGLNFNLDSCDSSFCVGRGAVWGSLGPIAIPSAESVSLCFEELRPGRGRFEGTAGRFVVISFWKSCNEYMSFILGLIHWLLA
jgi:hypothetical protein